jgi:hypothetical protein
MSFGNKAIWLSTLAQNEIMFRVEEAGNKSDNCEVLWAVFFHFYRKLGIHLSSLSKCWWCLQVKDKRERELIQFFWLGKHHFLIMHPKPHWEWKLAHTQF